MRRTRRATWAVLLLLTVGCGADDAGKTINAAPAERAAATPGGTMKSTEAADARLAAFAARFLEEYLERNPTRATEVGAHRHDGRWPDRCLHRLSAAHRKVAIGHDPPARLRHSAVVVLGAPAILSPVRYLVHHMLLKHA